MKNANALVLAVMSSVAIMTTHVAALEVTAGSKDLQNATIGFDERLSASNSILQTAINQMLTCNKKRMLFTSDATDPARDTDGCVPLPLPPNVTLSLEDRSVAIGETFTGNFSFTKTYTIPASVKAWGNVSLQMRVTAPDFNNGARTYQIADLSSDQAVSNVHSNGTDGCASRGNGAYYVSASYTAATRTVTFTYSTGGRIKASCGVLTLNLDSMQYKEAVLTQN